MEELRKNINLPLDLIQNMVKYKAKINLEKATVKPGKKS